MHTLKKILPMVLVLFLAIVVISYNAFTKQSLAAEVDKSLDEIMAGIEITTALVQCAT